jgi:hypothetical protein
MNIYEDTNPRELKELLHQINQGDAVLPDFQRDFVWDPNMTIDLVVSIAQNYPAGSLLRIRNTKNLFAYRQFAGAPPVNGGRPTYLVLDGQQRLTSLFQAFYGVGENRYFINLKKLLAGSDFEDAVFHFRAKQRQAKHLEDFENQAKELVLPLSVLKGGHGDFLQWQRRVARRAPDDGARVALEDRLDAIDALIQTIDDYRFPVVTLSDSTEAEPICTIFETLNRTGVKLSPFELLTARFWHQELNLRKRWADAIEKYPRIKDFQVDAYYSLQIVALLGRESPSCKRKDVLELEKSTVEAHWDAAIDGLGKALEFLEGSCGVLTPDWLPYSTILIPMAAIFARTHQLKGPQAGAARDKIGRWFWCAVFGQRYESAANSQSVIDFGEVLAWVNGSGSEPEAVRTLRFDPSLLRDVTPRQRAMYRGVIALVLRHHSCDFHTGEPLTLELIAAHSVDDHHVFPDGYLKKKDVVSGLRDCVLNHTLIDRETNNRIRSRAPSDYMAEIRGERGDGKYSELMTSHLLPSGADSPFWRDDYDAFLDWRQKLLFDEIKVVTGLGAG